MSPRRRPAWAGWLLVLVAPLVALGMLVLTSQLRDRAARSADARVVLAEIAFDVRNARSLLGGDERARAAGLGDSPRPMLAAQLKLVRPRLDRQVARLRSVDDRAAAPVTAAARRVLSELDGLLPALVVGEDDVAVRAAALLGALDGYGRAVDAAARDRRDAARIASRRAQRGTALTFLLGTLAFVVLFWRFDRLRQAEARRAAEQLHRLAHHDPLTGLGNRRKLAADAAKAADLSSATVLVFDLDGFKPYNDTFGHEAGDALLERLGRRLAARLDGGGRAYRLGGDEFGVLLADAPDDVALAVLREAFTDRRGRVEVGASCGMAGLDEADGDLTAALRLADQRLYADKAARRSAGLAAVR